VVTPKFKDRRPICQIASEMMERCIKVAFDRVHMAELMKQIRDDVVLHGRGVPWCRYESGKGGGGYYDSERVCIDYKHRKDFLHSISRCWYEVTWVAGASYLTRAQARDRFYKYSGTSYQDAEYKVDKDSQAIGGADARERAKFWEIWHKEERRVVWVAEGCEDILDEETPPHLDLEDFFPCPCPAYGTLQRGSLVPVPDSMQYKDQLDELNLLTGRIHALSDALEVKGFYPAGGSEIAEAVETAVKIKNPGRVLVPINNWAAFGGSKEVIIWMPIDIIAQTITTLITTRKQVIEDVYQITGLSDIMRGSTDARETLGAQQLKSQFGSSRIKDKQLEMVRVARDLTVIVSEITTEKFATQTLVEMAQMQIPTQAAQQQQAMSIQQQIAGILQKAQQASAAPGAQQMMQQNPEQVQQIVQQVQQQVAQLGMQIQKITAEPNLEQVLGFLRDNRVKCFTLDIQTDSTIMVDEKAEKEASVEFLGVLGTLLPQLMQLIAAEPKTVDFAGEVLKFATAPYRAGRQLDGAIDELVEQMKAKGDQPRGDDPTTATNKTMLQIEQLKQETIKEKNQAENQFKMIELQLKDRHEQMKIASAEKIKAAELQQKQQDDAVKAQLTSEKAMAEREKSQMELLGKQHDMQLNAQKAAMAAQAAQAKQQDMKARQSERQAAQQFKQQQQKPPANQGF